MTVSTMAAAKFLGQRSGWSLSNLELQKYLYIAHMLHLGQHGEPLIDGHFEAWDYGPIVPRLYHKAKAFGAGPVKDVFPKTDGIRPGSPESDSLEKALDMLQGAEPGRLVAISHANHGAWARHYRSDRRSIVIPNADIAEEYRNRVHAARQRE